MAVVAPGAVRGRRPPLPLRTLAVEDRECVRGVFLGTPSRTSRMTYYDLVAAPSEDAESIVSGLVRAGAAAAYASGA